MSALLYYTEIYLGCKFFIEKFYKLNQIITWMNIIYPATQGSIQPVSYITEKVILQVE